MRSQQAERSTTIAALLAEEITDKDITTYDISDRVVSIRTRKVGYDADRHGQRIQSCRLNEDEHHPLESISSSRSQLEILGSLSTRSPERKYDHT